jgi:hypothetical protein
MTNQEYEKKLQELQTEIDELKANKPTEYKRWRSENDGVYYYMDDCGKCDSAYEGYGSIDDYRYNTGNYFKTEKEAEQHKAYLLALQIIKDDAEGFVPDWKDRDQTKWQGFYEYSIPRLSYLDTYEYQYQGAVCFKSEEAIQASQEEHKAEWLTVLGVEQ